MSSEYVKDIIQHKTWVAENMQIGANELFRRAAIHDNSKFSPEEFEAYEEAFPELQKYAYGTEEFKAALDKIKPAIQHHVKGNRHHPEYFPNGVNGMNLIDLFEMICDWKAASKRSKTDISKGLEINRERFGIDDQLYQILKNTLPLIDED